MEQVRLWHGLPVLEELMLVASPHPILSRLFWVGITSEHICGTENPNALHLGICGESGLGNKFLECCVLKVIVHFGQSGFLRFDIRQTSTHGVRIRFIKVLRAIIV